MDALVPILDYLNQFQPSTDSNLNGWQISRVTGGWNNLLYRATNAEYDLAIKFAMRDKRDRAGREFQALTALHQLGAQLAPAPILLDRDRYRLPVVVQTWVHGDVKNEPPANDDEWMQLIEHYAAIHRITPADVKVKLPNAFVTARNAEDGKARVREQLVLLPLEAQPQSLQDLIQRFEATQFPEWNAHPVVLCRVDPNILNFICRADKWLSVDWENSGWGDPAFEIGDFMAHPAYANVSSSRWDWVIENYARAMNDGSLEMEIRTQYRIMLVWWVVRCARYLYDIPRGNDRRLVERPNEWQADFQAKYEHYVNLANTSL